MQFQAVYEGKIVSYPAAATFVIEQRTRKTNFEVKAHKETISDALVKFTRVRRKGHQTKLSASVDGHMKPIMSVRS